LLDSYLPLFTTAGFITPSSRYPPAFDHAA
jgi:hypothetical protein